MSIVCILPDNFPSSESSEIEKEVRKAMMEEDSDKDGADTDEEEFSPKRPAKVSPPAKKTSKPVSVQVVRTKKISVA